MKKLFAITMLVLMTVIMSGCSSVKAEEKEKTETMHIHGIELLNNGFEVDGEFCYMVEKLHFYGDETEKELLTLTADEYCQKGNYFEVVYNPKTMKVIELHITDDASLWWYSSQLRPVDWYTWWKG